MIGRLHGSLTVLRALPGQRRVPFLSRTRVAELREARIRATVDYATAHVPHYRELAARGELDRGSIRTPEELRSLPLIDKPLLARDPARFRSDAVSDPEAVPFTTSGSTWRPVTVHHDRRSLLQNIAYSERDRAVESALRGGGLRYVIARISHETATGAKVNAFYGRSALRPFAPVRRFIPLQTPLERVVELLGEIRPDVLIAHGSYLEEFFKVVAHRGLDLRPPRVVRYAADGMSEESRAFIERRFGVPVLSSYSAVESFKIGYFCELRRGFHLHEDLCDLWIADATGRACAPGEVGEVVISNLVNRATVLLNYRLGDLGRLSREPCPCGRTSPVLTLLDGRVSQIVHLASGDIVHPFAVLTVVRRYADVVRCQLVQHERERFELKVVLLESAALERIRGPLTAELRVVLGGSTVEITEDRRADDGRGKLIPVVALRP